jgi:cell division transport system permease protein
LRRLRTSLRSGLRGITGAPLVFVLSVTTMAAGMFLLAGYLLVVQNVRGVLASYGQDLSLVAFLGADRSGPPEAIANAIRGLPDVEQVSYVSPDVALERLRADLGNDAQILESLDQNPLPGSFEVSLVAGARTPERVRGVASELAELPGVEDVRYGEAWIESYARILRALEWVGAGLGVSLLLVLGVIVAGTVRLAVHSRADEIQIQRLVGAGGFLVRLPFLVEGALQGAFGAGLALLLLWGLFRLGLPLVGEAMTLVLGVAAPVFFGAGEQLALVLLGATLGFGAAVLSLLRLDDTA